MCRFAEPTLEDILSDEAVVRLMQRDHVLPEEVRALMQSLKRHIGRVATAI